jgi:hypothetical protein
MIHLLCRNKVADFAKWKQVFDSHARAHREAGQQKEISDFELRIGD